MIDKEPEFQDEVKHKLCDIAGTVIAVYPGGIETNYLDVRGTDNEIYYKTPANNWVVTKVCDE